MQERDPTCAPSPTVLSPCPSSAVRPQLNVPQSVRVAFRYARVDPGKWHAVRLPLVAVSVGRSIGAIESLLSRFVSRILFQLPPTAFESALSKGCEDVGNRGLFTLYRKLVP